MIFALNTDVKHGDTIYHVQNEAREGERLLQTQVFVRGRYIGKIATSTLLVRGSFARRTAAIRFVLRSVEWRATIASHEVLQTRSMANYRLLPYLRPR